MDFSNEREAERFLRILKDRIDTRYRFVQSQLHLYHILSAPEKQFVRKIAVENVADCDKYMRVKAEIDDLKRVRLARRQSLVFNDSAIGDGFGAVRFLTENYLDSSYDSKGFRRFYFFLKQGID